LPVFAFFLREYNRYSPDFTLRIIFHHQVLSFKMIADKQRVAFHTVLDRVAEARR